MQMRASLRGAAGVPRSRENDTPQDPTVGLCLWPCGGPRGWAFSSDRGTPVKCPSSPRKKVGEAPRVVGAIMPQCEEKATDGRHAEDDKCLHDENQSQVCEPLVVCFQKPALLFASRFLRVPLRLHKPRDHVLRAADVPPLPVSSVCCLCAFRRYRDSPLYPCLHQCFGLRAKCFRRHRPPFLWTLDQSIGRLSRNLGWQHCRFLPSLGHLLARSPSLTSKHCRHQQQEKGCCG